MGTFDFLLPIFAPSRQVATAMGQPGLLDDPELQRQMLSQGLLSFGAELLKAAGPSRTRTNLGSALASGLAAARQGADSTLNQVLKAKMAGLEFEKADLEKKKFQADMDAAAAKQAAVDAMSRLRPAAFPGDETAWAATVRAMPDVAAKYLSPADWKVIEYQTGGTKVSELFNPITQERQPLGSGPAWKPRDPTEFEIITRGLGLTPGSPEYQAAAMGKLFGTGIFDQTIVGTAPDGKPANIYAAGPFAGQVQSYITEPVGAQKFSEAFKDPSGNWVQRNLATNEIKVLNNAPAPKDQWSEPFMDTQGNLVQYNMSTKERKVLNAADAPKEPKAANIINLRLPDGSMRGFDANTQQGEIMTALAQGAVEVGLGVQATSTDNLFAPSDKRVGDIQGQVSRSEDTLSLLRSSMNLLQRPEGEWATGLSGMAAEEVGGYLQQLTGIDASAALGGPPLEQVQSARTQFRNMIGRLIPAVTGDTTGKYSNADKALAEEAQKALNPNASVEQVRGAYKNLYEVEVRSNARRRVELQGLDLRTADGEKAYVREIMKVDPALSADEAARMVISDLYGR